MNYIEVESTNGRVWLNTAAIQKISVMQDGNEDWCFELEVASGQTYRSAAPFRTSSEAIMHIQRFASLHK